MNLTEAPGGSSGMLQSRPSGASSRPSGSDPEKLSVPFLLLRARHWQQILCIPRAPGYTVEIPEYPFHHPLKVWFVPYLPALCFLLKFGAKVSL
ncbi:hypothetical protein D3C86_1811670 [compost metagenome]